MNKVLKWAIQISVKAYFFAVDFVAKLLKHRKLPLTKSVDLLFTLK